MKLFYTVCLLTLAFRVPAAAAGPEKPYFSVACPKGGGCLAEPGGFSVPKRPGVKRVFVIGAPGALPDPAILKTALPGVEVINCSARTAQDRKKILSEALGYQPDLAVALGAGPADPFAPEGFYQRYKKAAYRLLKKLHLPQPAPEVEGLTARTADFSALASLAKSGKTPLLFCTLPVNLGGQPPAYYPAPEDESFAAGLLQLGQNAASAAAYFAKALEKNPGNPLVEFYLAKALEGKGLFAEARAHYARALDLDLWQERPSPALNGAIRKAAAASGAGLCDLEGAFLRVSSNGLSGFDQFSYGASWRPVYDGLIWGEIAGASGLGWFAYKAPAALPALTDQDLRATLSGAAAELRAFPSDGPSVLSEPAIAAFGFAEARRKGLAARFLDDANALGGAHKATLLAHLAAAASRRGDSLGAAGPARLALASEPANPRFRFMNDLSLLGSVHKKEAKTDLELLFSEPSARIAAIAAARAYGLLPPGSPEPALPSETNIAGSKKLADEAVAGLMKGDPVSARGQLVEALKLNPLNAEALMSLCSLKYSSGELQAALAACDGVPGAAASRYQDSGSELAADSLRMKALIYFRLGSLPAAAGTLKAAIAAAPPGWKNLAAARADLAKAEGN
jgi:tetratricopeptide (TPR) repeat protein